LVHNYALGLADGATFLELGKLPFPRFNPSILSYNASGVKIYNATSSLVRFESKNIFFYIEILQCWRCNCKVGSLQVYKKMISE
jgi:hypothetical protein